MKRVTLLKYGLLAMASFLFLGDVGAQITLSTYPTNSPNNGSSAITFEVSATVGVNIQEFTTVVSAGPVEVWYRPGGVLHPSATTPVISAANGWILHQSGIVPPLPSTTIPTTVALSTPISVLATQTYGICLSGAGMRYQNAAAPSVFTDANISILTGANEGFGGTITSFIASREFCGSVTYTLVPTTPDNAGVEAIVSPSSVCPGISPVEVAVRNYGTNALTSFNVHATIDDGTVLTTIPTVNISSVNMASNTSMNVLLGNYSFQAGKSYDIKVWTALPNGLADSDPSGDTLEINGFKTSLSGTYTVGPAKDYPTILAAVNDLNNFGVCGPTIFDITGTATFTDQVEITAVLGASAVNTITFRGHGATVSVSPSSTNYAAIRLNGAQYITLDSLNIICNDATYGWGIHLGFAADYNKITNCVIDLTALTSTGTSNGCGIMASNSNTSYTGYGNTANYTLIQGNTILGGTLGMYNAICLNGTSTTVGCTGNQIIDNKIQDAYIYSIRSYYQEDGIIRGNDISQPTKTGVTTFYGLYLYYNRGMSVSNNKIYNVYLANQTTTSTSYPIYNYYNNSTVANPTVFSNNLISDIYTNGTVYAIYHTAGSYNKYYHNTISLDNPNATAGTFRGVYQTTASTNLEFTNNIFSITQGGSGVKTGLYFATNTSAITSQNNVIYMNSLSGTQYTGYWDAVNYATLTDWKGANSGAFDQLSVDADPVFQLPSNIYYAPGSPGVNNIGLAGTGVATDITGAPRNATSPDPGAYEFTPANDDAGVVAISGIYQRCPGNTNVIAEIKNYGVSTLFSASVNWSLNGVLQTSVPFIGSLGSTNTALVNLGSLNMLDGVSYNIVAWTTQPNSVADGNKINDTTKAEGVKTAMSGTYSVGPAGTFANLNVAATELSSRGVCGAVVLNVATGTYSDQVQFDAIPGVTPVRTVTVNGNGATIAATPSSSNYAIVRLNGAKYVTIDSLNLTGLDATYGWGFHLTNGADFNTIKRCIIDLSAHTSTTAANGCGIALSASTTSPTSGGNNANNCTFTKNRIIGGTTGLYYGVSVYGLSGATGVSNNQFIDNRLEDIYAYNFYSVYGANNIYRGNDMSRPTKVTVTSFYGFYMSTGSVGNIMELNRIHNTHDMTSSTTGAAYAFYFTGADASSSNPNIARNNLIYNFNGTGTNYGIYSTSSDHAQYYYNTFSFDHVAATAGITYGIYQTTTATGVEFKNNIVSITRGGSGAKYGMYYNTTTSTIASENNVIYVNSAGSGVQRVGRFGTVEYPGMSAWRTGTSFDLLSDSTDPRFIDILANEYTPNSFGANNIASPIAGITKDFYGVTRHATTPDPGAIEFLPVPTNDSCHQAIAIGSGITLGTTLGSTPDFAPTCVVSDAANGVWYTYVAGGDFVTFSLCGSNYDTRIRVFTGSCTGLTCVTGNEDFCSTQSEVSGCTENGITYYILVHGNGSAAGEFNLNITEIPVQQATISATSTMFCPGDTVTLTAGTANGYLWSDASMSTSQSIQVAAAGSFYVVATDTNGCIDTSSSVSVAQHVVVPPVVTAMGDTAFCDGDSLVLSANTHSSYLWNDAGNSTSKTIVVKTAGSYQVTTVDGNGCTESSAPLNTAILPVPVVDLGEDETICDDGSITLTAPAGMTSYFWSTGDTSQSISFSASVGTHTINVSVTDGNGCQGGDNIQITVQLCDGIDEFANTASVNVYPNPGEGIFNLVTSGFNGDNLQIHVADFQGRKVYVGQLNNMGSTPQSLDLSQLAKGMYMMTVNDNDQMQTLRLVIR